MFCQELWLCDFWFICTFVVAVSQIVKWLIKLSHTRITYHVFVLTTIYHFSLSQTITSSKPRTPTSSLAIQKLSEYCDKLNLYAQWKLGKRKWLQKFVRHDVMSADYQPSLRKYSLDRRRADRNSKNHSIQQAEESPRTTFKAKYLGHKAKDLRYQCQRLGFWPQ